MPRIKNAKFSGQYFYMNTNISVDFQICISAPLKYLTTDNRFELFCIPLILLVIKIKQLALLIVL